MASVKNINTDYTLNVGPAYANGVWSGNGIFTVNAQTVFTGNVIYNVPSVSVSPFITVAANNTGALTDMGLLGQTGPNTFAGLRFDTIINAWQTSNSVTSNGSPITAYANINTPPAGANTEIQFNNNGVFGGNANLTFNTSTNLLFVGGNLSASGNVVSQNIGTPGFVSAVGNVSGNYILGNGSLLTGVITSLSNINNGNSNVTIADSAGDVTISVSGIGNVVVFSPTGEYVTGVISASGNITGGNLLTAGLISTGGNITTGNLLTAGVISATGNVTGNFILGNGSQLTGIITSVSNVANGDSNLNIGSANANLTISVSTVGNIAVFSPTGVSVLGTIAGNGNIIGGNVTTAGLVTATGNITGGNILTAGLISATDTIVSAANITGGNITTAGIVTATGNIIGNYFIGNGSQLTDVSASSVYANALIGNTLSANVLYSSLQSVGTLANISVSGNADIANISIVNTTFTSTDSNGNLILFAGTGGIGIPAGNTSQRPVSPPVGVTRFNTITSSIETWDGAAWVTSGNSITPGTIVDQQITPDGVSNSYLLVQPSTAAEILVAINGVNQVPTLSYTVTGTTITFSQIPMSSDIIDIRFITYLTSVSSLSNSSGNSVVNITPSGNIQFTTANNLFAIMTASSFNVNYPVSAAGNVTIGGLLTSPPQTKAATDPGTVGQICWDSNYIYVCTASNTWKRTGLTGGY